MFNCLIYKLSKKDQNSWKRSLVHRVFYKKWILQCDTSLSWLSVATQLFQIQINVTNVSKKKPIKLKPVDKEPLTVDLLRVIW